VQHEPRGNCHDNAVAESFFSTLKSELGERFESHGDAKMELFDYIECSINQRRRNSTIDRSARLSSNDGLMQRKLNRPRDGGSPPFAGESQRNRWRRQ